MKLIVLGAGNWGTTLAMLFAQKNEVYLWTETKKDADIINKKKENVQFLPGVKLPKNIIVEEKYDRDITAEDVVVIAIPSRKVEELADEFIHRGIDECTILNVSKGVKHTTFKTISEIIAQKLPKAKFANLSGPTIAKELAEGLPAKAVLASEDISILFKLQDILENDLLKFEFSRDVQGIELSASLKGLIAIAVGLADGYGFQTNIFGLIMTYGLQEFNQVMNFLGVSTKTVYGIAGMGDLITTCLSENSRNRRFGKLLAQGMDRESALQEVGMVVEGVSMAKTVQKFSKFNLSIPLISTIAKIIFEDVDDIKTELMDTINQISI